MSVVARQGFKYTLIGYFGFLIGTLATIFLFPRDLEFYGKLRFIMPVAEMLMPIVVFGLSFSNVKFFNQTQKDNRHHNMLTLSLMAVALNFIIFCVGFFTYFEIFPKQQTMEIWKIKWLILPLILILSLSSIFNKYISNYKRIVIPNIFENLFPKIANIGAFSLFFFLGCSEATSYIFFFAVFIISFLGYFLYSNKLEPIKADLSIAYFKKNQLWKEIFNYSLFGFLGNIGNYIAFRVDNYMIGEFLSFEDNAIYSILLSVLSFIMIPQMGLYNISAPIINKTIAENDFKELDRFHKKTSLSLFFLGAVLFSSILAGFPYLTHFIKNGEQLRTAMPIVLILGSAMLFDLATGFNGHIISLSKYYRFNIVVMLFLALATIGLNFLFLKHTNFGIVGIAIATGVSLTLFNIIKIIFNYRKFGVFPLTIEMIFASIICTTAITLAIILPDSKNNLINLIYKPAVVLMLIFIGNYFLKIYDLSKYLNKSFIKSLLKF